MKTCVRVTISSAAFAMASILFYYQALALGIVFLGVSINVYFFESSTLHKQIRSLHDLSEHKLYDNESMAFLGFISELLIIVGSLLFLLSEIFEFV